MKGIKSRLRYPWRSPNPDAASGFVIIFRAYLYVQTENILTRTHATLFNV